LQVLTVDELATLTSEIATRFVDDSSQRWWWTQLREQPEVLAYGEADGLAALTTVVGAHERAVLVFTNEDPIPDGAIAGTVSDLIELLRASAGFEYAMVAEDFSWMIFDTHHNEILISRPSV
jgi:hypothetical protein